MQKRGYPMGDFDLRAADISVDHPQVVEHYRAAHDIALRDRHGDVDTEGMRRRSFTCAPCLPNCWR